MKEYTGNHYFTSFSLVQFILNLVSFQVYGTTFSVFLPRCVGARPVVVRVVVRWLSGWRWLSRVGWLVAYRAWVCGRRLGRSIDWSRSVASLWCLFCAAVNCGEQPVDSRVPGPFPRGAQWGSAPYACAA